ncbi:HAD family hydrolase [Selenomonas sp. oral taxon 138]|uniref:HAD family hydrolase n=1 Tax=Selenomonas sp. oral taxon 138 TaxID=712532 RepID=UPI0002A35421|nr:HAD-IA family hydrolase [Selenomonas sp. oral taxon 138]EKX98689.1 putative phosphoglycolate phosphatase, bacterial [Selenomonas sp. oral taxon 138 str. F0429]
MQYKAAIFDLDGTLVDSLNDLADSANAVLHAHGFPVYDVEAYRYFVGNGSRRLIERILPKDRASDAAFVRNFIAEYKECYAAHLLDQTKPYEGIMDMLEELQRRGIPMAVCTNKHQSAAEAIMEELFPREMFCEIIGDQDGLPRKPDPSKVLHIMKNMGVTGDKTLYFGDTSVDMDTARNAGAFSVGVLWGFRPAEELTEHGADILLKHPMELFEKVTFAER